MVSRFYFRYLTLMAPGPPPKHVNARGESPGLDRFGLGDRVGRRCDRKRRMLFHTENR